MSAFRGVWAPARARRLAIGLAIGVAIGVAPPSAGAREEDAEPIEVTYTAVEACPSKEQFIALVRRHTTKWRLAEGGAGVRSFRVRLAARGRDVVGALVVANVDSKKTREIVGPDCEAVARALAVATALAIDPQAELSETPIVESEPEPPPIEPPPHVEPPGASPPQPRSERRPPPSPPKARMVSFAVEGRVELTSAVIADPLPVLGVALDARLRPPSWPSWLTPSLALGIRQSLPNEVQGASDFLWSAATIRLCPVRLVTLAARLDVAPCAEVALGALHADAHGVPDARSTTRVWLDRSAGVRAAFRIHGPWSVGASFSLVAPVTRHRFALASGELISQAPSLGVLGGILCELRL